MSLSGGGGVCPGGECVQREVDMSRGGYHRSYPSRRDLGPGIPSAEKGSGTMDTHALKGTWDQGCPPPVDSNTPGKTVSSRNYCCGR